MGTDIHTTAEVRDPLSGTWRPAGKAFQSPDDWSYERYPTRELLEGLRADQLLGGLKSALRTPDPDDKYVSALRERVSEAARAAFDAYYERRKALAVDMHTDPKLRSRLRDGTPPLDSEARESIIRAVLEHNEAARDDPSLWKIDIRLERCDDEPPFMTDEPYGDRCYDLFAALANVRNAYGFAFVDTGDALVPIAEPRGYPEDVCEETVEELPTLDGYSHTASWLTLRELEHYDWDQPKVKRGVVDEETYLRMREHGVESPLDLPGPVSYSGAVWAEDSITMSPEEYDDWVARGRPPLRDEPVNVHVQLEWVQPLRASIPGYFFELTLPGLRAQIPQGGDADDVRMVFNFDS